MQRTICMHVTKKRCKTIPVNSRLFNGRQRLCTKRYEQRQTAMGITQLGLFNNRALTSNQTICIETKSNAKLATQGLFFVPDKMQTRWKQNGNKTMQMHLGSLISNKRALVPDNMRCKNQKAEQIHSRQTACSNIYMQFYECSRYAQVQYGKYNMERTSQLKQHSRISTGFQSISGSHSST